MHKNIYTMDKDWENTIFFLNKNRCDKLFLQFLAGIHCKNDKIYLSVLDQFLNPYHIGENLIDQNIRKWPLKSHDVELCERVLNILTEWAVICLITSITEHFENRGSCQSTVTEGCHFFVIRSLSKAWK